MHEEMDAPPARPPERRVWGAQPREEKKWGYERSNQAGERERVV